MYPEDKLPTQPTVTPPTPFIAGALPTTAQVSKPKSHVLRYILIVIVGTLLVTSAASAALIMRGETKPKTTVKTAVVTPAKKTVDTDACAAKLSQYQSKTLGIQFCYPTAWGDVSVADATLSPTDTGTRVKLGFANETQVHIGLVSQDWSSTVTTTPLACADLAVQAFPNTATYSTEWLTTLVGKDVASADRGIAMSTDTYLVQEHVDNTQVNGVCLKGYQAFGGVTYTIATATYFVDFSGTVTTPEAHITTPTTLVPTADRDAFVALVKSISEY